MMLVDQRIIDDVINVEINVAPLLPLAIVTLFCVAYLSRNLLSWSRFRP